VIKSTVIRFAMIGVVNTATYYAMYLLFRQVMPYLVAHIVAFLLSMTGSFFLNCYFTFRTRPTVRKFLLFPLSNATNFVATSVGLYVLVQYAGMGERTAPLLAAALAIPVTFAVAQVVLVGRAPRVESAS
jgi:putative flippase GtrA